MDAAIAAILLVFIIKHKTHAAQLLFVEAQNTMHITFKTLLTRCGKCLCSCS
jgi:predicted ribonuclease YlaK